MTSVEARLDFLFFLIVRYLNKLENGRQQKKISCVYLSSKGFLPSLGYLDSNFGVGVWRGDKN